MSEPQSALGNPVFEGFATVREIGPIGMITLRATLSAPVLAKALAGVGLALPAQRRILRQGARAAGWMSSDELLILLPHSEVPEVLASLSKALQGEHHLLADISDARAVFRIEGVKAGQVLAKLCPVDLDRLEPGELRRSRAAQVACAFWAEDDGFTLISFRSVAGYVMGLLTHSAQTGSELYSA
ncbi:sarcosine oxidase subunit gamma [Szabonella alba]|uniref:Sarcosine oxidase subunit gamma n=1 Tax=Szabonella alba TaxID=2804194 RepID=A0A8K0VF79_9RHOB|nr:sarcosine oxidase subunit gamma family protein [Szabonella alba]MBL4919168.1 sarcosine oxidase subunit gamma [Szabonella alba]